MHRYLSIYLSILTKLTNTTNTTKRGKGLVFLILTGLLALEGLLWLLVVPDFAILFMVHASGDLWTVTQVVIFDWPWKLLFTAISWLLAYALILQMTKLEPIEFHSHYLVTDR